MGYDEILFEINSMLDMGIYPKAVQSQDKEQSYQERDGFKNGWNACVMECIPKIKEKLGLYESPWTEPEKLFIAADDGCFYYNDGWHIFLNDTWYWACSDCEEIPKDKYEEVADLFRAFGRAVGIMVK